MLSSSRLKKNLDIYRSWLKEKKRTSLPKGNTNVPKNFFILAESEIFFLDYKSQELNMVI